MVSSRCGAPGAPFTRQIDSDACIAPCRAINLGITQVQWGSDSPQSDHIMQVDQRIPKARHCLQKLFVYYEASPRGAV